MKRFLPLFIFLFLLGLLFTVIALSNPDPVITSIHPQVAFPGERLEIRGENFGKQREYGYVSISGVRATASHYLEWTDSNIRMVIPPEINSGLIYVHTKAGRSDGIFFTNEASLPEIPDKKTQATNNPAIISVSPSGAAIGSRIRITGKNFGIYKEQCSVIFPLNSENGSGELMAGYSEFESWKEDEIILPVPPGAKSGLIKVKTNNKESEPFPFSIPTPGGTILYSEQADYHINMVWRIDSALLLHSWEPFGTPPRIATEMIFNAAPLLEQKKRFPLSLPQAQNNLYFWLPLLQKVPSQTGIDIETPSLTPYLEMPEAFLYKIENLSSNDFYTFEMKSSVNRYTIETRINTDNIPTHYNKGDPNYYQYVVPDQFVPSDHPDIKAAVGQAITYKTPYYRSMQMYEYIRNTLEFDPHAGMRSAIKTLNNKTGGSFGYASLFTAMERYAGIPSRIVGGALRLSNGTWASHFWSEFYLTGVGWIPVDPALGDNAYGITSTDKLYYFGNLDNKRITLSKGILNTKVMGARNNLLIIPDKGCSLQSVYCEYNGDLLDFNLDCSILEEDN